MNNNAISQNSTQENTTRENQLPQAGERFPDFNLPAAIPSKTGTSQSTFSLADFSGQLAVLFFYPRDATPGCTIEVCGFRDEYSGFEKLGVPVVGISRDKLSAHLKFIEKQELPYPLLADAEQTLIRACNLIVHKTMYGKPVTKVLRSTFVLDENGVVLRIYENVTPLGHAQEVLGFVREQLGLKER